MTEEYGGYSYTIEDKSKDVFVKVVFDNGEPYEASIHDFNNISITFSEIPPSEANLKKFNSVNAFRELSVVNVTATSKVTLQIVINDEIQEPKMEGYPDESGIVFYATIEFK